MDGKRDRRFATYSRRAVPGLYVDQQSRPGFPARNPLARERLFVTLLERLRFRRCSFRNDENRVRVLRNRKVGNIPVPGKQATFDSEHRGTLQHLHIMNTIRRE